MTRIASLRGHVPILPATGGPSKRDMSRVRPATLESMRTVHGVGESKLADYGERFLEEIAGFGAGGEGEAKPDGDAPVVEVVKDGVEQAGGELGLGREG